MTDIATRHALLALLIYGAWTLALVAGIAALRFREVKFRGHRINKFAVWGEDVSAFSERLCRAHANCYENLGVFTAIVGVALASGQAAVVAPLVLWSVAARLCQSCAHIYSTRSRWVLVRFSFMVLQIGIQAWWVTQLAGALWRS